MSKDAIYNLSDDELILAKTKNTDKNRLGFAVLLKYFQLESRYPKHIKFIDPLMLNTLANQLNIAPSMINQFDWEGRSTERFRQEIREFLGYRKVTSNDIYDFKAWLFKNIFPKEIKFKHLKIDIPGAKLKNVFRAIKKIDCLRQLDLPVDVLSSLSEKLIKK